ncbi:MAG TPA: FGGY-family carbohydrate kinase, partial [Thermomicrobiaceae bacterium]|nr:FGGY-family carbohydrate kinase [Thermomicrobiaceae bacterium]
ELGMEPRRARVTNGGSRSRLWRQIVADVLGMPLESIVRHPGSSLGAAFAAGMGVDHFRDWSEIERFVAVEERIELDPAAHGRYVELYGLYRALYPTLAGTMHRLARFDPEIPLEGQV